MLSQVTPPATVDKSALQALVDQVAGTGTKPGTKPGTEGTPATGDPTDYGPAIAIGVIGVALVAAGLVLLKRKGLKRS